MKGIGTVGVFVDASCGEVRRIARECRLDYVQLHGAESPEYCRGLGYPVIKAVRIGESAEAGWEQYDVDYFLFDSYVPGQAGGTGQTFDWSGFLQIKEQIRRPYFVAGGLTPHNVGKAVAALAPDGVDVSGGVETDGTKDAEKIRQFITAARGVR